MSAFHPENYAEAVATHKPLSRATPLQAVSKRRARTRSPAGDEKPLLQNRIKRKAVKKKAKRVKTPSTAKVKKIFSDMVRERAGWKCVRCGRDCSERRGLLHCSHFWAVGFTATRFDFDNCDALCYVCHYGQMRTGWEYNKQGEYREFMVKKLGHDGYDRLEQKARVQMKLSDAKEQFLAAYVSVPTG